MNLLNISEENTASIFKLRILHDSLFKKPFSLVQLYIKEEFLKILQTLI